MDSYDAREGNKQQEFTFLRGDPTAATYVRVLRVVEYIGPREWVENVVARSMHGTKVFNTANGVAAIRTGTVGSYPEVLNGVTGIQKDATDAPMKKDAES